MLGFPLALLGLLTVPVLVVVYRLQSRRRTVRVSSLMLWRDPRESRDGGRRLRRQQRPLELFLELAALVLLALAAADPRVPVAQGGRPLVVVLDDSFSMRAGAPDSARQRAEAALLDRLAHEPGGTRVQAVLAGTAPRLLGAASGGGRAAQAWLEAWRCHAPAARLDEAIRLARQVGGHRARVLVLSDHAPAATPEAGAVQWSGFGSPHANVAFVNAARTAVDGGERLLLEVGNLAAVPQARWLTLRGAGEPRRDRLELAAGETRRLFLALPPGAGAVHAELEPDALPVDDQLVLVPEPLRPVRVALRVGDPRLAAALGAGLEATRRVLLGAAQAQLVLTDAADPGAERQAAGGPDAWVVRIASEPEAVAHVGPFVLDRRHALSRGLSLDGVVWAAGPGTGVPGRRIVASGAVPLLTEVEHIGGRRELWLRLRPELSNLLETPDWPILVWNLVQWRAAHAPGPRQANVRAGSEAVLVVEPDAGALELIEPDGTRRQVETHAGVVAVETRQPGVYRLGAASFAANVLARDESDLGASATGAWGDWGAAPESPQAPAERSVGTLLAAAALLVLALHAALVGRAGGGRSG